MTRDSRLLLGFGLGAQIDAARMTTMKPEIRLAGDPPGGGTVTLSNLEYPHSDALTLFRVSLRARDLEAECSIESVAGDEGHDPDRSTVEGASSTFTLSP